MAIKIKKLFESLVPKSNPKPDDVAEELDDNVVDAEDVRVTELNALEEMINEKTMDLQGSREQIKDIAAATYPLAQGKDDAQVKDTISRVLPQPLIVPAPSATAEPLPVKDTSGSPKPVLELKLQSLKLTPEGKEDLTEEQVAAELTPVPAKPLPDVKGPVLSATTIAANEKDKKNNEASDMISQIFNREEEVDDPLAGLKGSLPNVAMRDILDEAREIKAMLMEWNQN